MRGWNLEVSRLDSLYLIVTKGVLRWIKSRREAKIYKFKVIIVIFKDKILWFDISVTYVLRMNKIYCL